jgi:transposase
MKFFQYRCELVAKVPRTWCRTDGVHQVPVPWAREGSGFTLMMEALVLLLSAEMPVNAMADLIDEHDTRLWRILRHPSASSKTDRPWQASDDSSGSDKQERMKSSTLSYFFQW